MAKHTPPIRSQDAQDPFQCPYMKIPQLYVDTLYHFCFVDRLGLTDEYIIMSGAKHRWPCVQLVKRLGWEWATTNAEMQCKVSYQNGGLRMVRIPTEAARLIDPDFCVSTNGITVSVNPPTPGG